MRRETKLVCTLGPACIDRIDELIAAGMDVARVNLSHVAGDDVSRAVRAVREAARRMGVQVGVMADLSGPKVRLGTLREGSAELREDTRFELRAAGDEGDARGAPTTHAGIGRDLEPGDRVLLADGAVELRVIASDTDVTTEVVRGGTVRSGAGVNLPAERLSLPGITDKDRGDLSHVLSLGVDIVAASFVRSSADVEELRALVDGRADVLAKIETGPAVRDADAIIAAADAVMVARGDLGAELAYEEIPIVQKDLLRRALAAGTASVVATQMLESMTASPRPTRAEASDVANAVLDGTDAILLSAETAIGGFPIAAARAACRIVEVADPVYEPPPVARGLTSDEDAIARAAALVSRSGADIAAISCFTRTGRTAMLMSRVRPRVPVLAFSPNEHALRRLALRRAVVPIQADDPGDTDAMVRLMDEQIRARGLAPGGALVLMAASIPAGSAETNFLKVHRLAAS